MYYDAFANQIELETVDDADVTLNMLRTLLSVERAFTTWTRKENASEASNPLALAQTQTDAPVELTRAS